MKKNRTLHDLWKPKEKHKAPTVAANSSLDKSPPIPLIVNPTEIPPINSTPSTSQTSSLTSSTSISETSSTTSDTSINPTSLITSEDKVTVFNDVKPHQPLLEFPFRAFDKQQRRFGKNWYMEHKWLEYNETEDKCYCFPCRVFLTKTVPFNKTWLKLSCMRQSPY